MREVVVLVVVVVKVVVVVAPAIAVVFMCLFLLNILICKGCRGVHDAVICEKQNKIAIASAPTSLGHFPSGTEAPLALPGLCFSFHSLNTGGSGQRSEGKGGGQSTNPKTHGSAKGEWGGVSSLKFQKYVSQLLSAENCCNFH